MSPEKMIHMANQIAIFFETKPEAEAREGFADHINKFWEPRMRRQLLDHLAAGGAGLRPLALEAANMIRKPRAA
jgi:formate dehydrogenase subunit delta